MLASVFVTAFTFLTSNGHLRPRDFIDTLLVIPLMWLAGLVLYRLNVFGTRSYMKQEHAQILGWAFEEE